VLGFVTARVHRATRLVGGGRRARLGAVVLWGRVNGVERGGGEVGGMIQSIPYEVSMR